MRDGPVFARSPLSLQHTAETHRGAKNIDWVHAISVESV